MRVLYDHQIFSYQALGGASRYFAELMTVFAERGEPAFDLGVTESPNEYLAQAPYYRGRTIARTGAAGFVRTYLRNELTTRRLARRGDHDVTHATFYDPAATHPGKLVVTVHDMIPERRPDDFTTTGVYGRFVTRRWIEGKRGLCKRADAIIAVSEHTKRDLVTFYGLDPARIDVIHLGTRISAAGTIEGLPARYVLYVGTRNTYKNFPFFVEAIAPLLGETLALVCVGGGAFDASEQALFARLGISDRVVQRRVSEAELGPAYAHAAAFVFPSLYEGFGIPILEAFACGCPALVANASCFPEVAGDAAAYFDPTDAASLREFLAEILASPARADELRHRGRERARAFTWERTADRTLDVYRATQAARQSPSRTAAQ